MFKIYVLKGTKIDIFSIIFLKVESSFNIQDRLFKYSVDIIDILMEGTVSQISKMMLKNFRKCFLFFDIK